ncbi:hypothetical protein GW17_00056087 [Ensete ventricosum]|nr:hypothetical protein GW17_00056087 [Ensete ventricosum]
MKHTDDDEERVFSLGGISSQQQIISKRFWPSNRMSLHEYSGPEKSRDVHTEALRVYDEEEEPARIVVCRLPETRSFSIRCRRRVFLHPLLLPYPVFFDFMVLAVSDPGCVLLRFHGNKSVRGVICNEIDTALFLANLNKSFRFRTYCMFNSS